MRIETNCLRWRELNLRLDWPAFLRASETVQTKHRNVGNLYDAALNGCF
jgi:hypothetical protein